MTQKELDGVVFGTMMMTGAVIMFSAFVGAMLSGISNTIKNKKGGVKNG